MEILKELFIIFSLSLFTALSGALSPGPFMVYIITKSIQNQKNGYLTGFMTVSGHAILEFLIMLLIFSGLSFILKNKAVMMLISLVGCVFLLFLGISLIVNVIRNRFDAEFLEKENNPGKRRNPIDNPLVGGILISMSNPYWWIWWVSIGAIFIARYQINPSNIPKVAAFYLGHETGDLICYVPLSIAAFLGRKRLNKQIYSIILFLCGAFISFFGIYMALSLFKDTFVNKI